jgi:hypothetical protein
VVQKGTTIQVNGAGFSSLTVINFFNAQAGGSVNLGGLNSTGRSRIPLTIINGNTFTLSIPAGALAGPSYIQAINPPFVPFSNSGNGSSGAFVLTQPISPTPTPTPTPEKSPTPRPSRAPTPAPTRTPTAIATPILISATRAGTRLALQDIGESGETIWTSNETWLLRLLNQFAATPELFQAFKTSTMEALVAKKFDDAVLQIAGANFVSAPEDAGLLPAWSATLRSGFSTIALDLHDFETNGVYGDKKNELPRANCNFTSNPKGSCTSATNTLTIVFNDPAIGSDLTTFFDWTGASSGESSPTVIAQDPLNPGTLIELPTRLVWQLRSKGTTLLSVVVDVQWLPSPCMTGKFLFDLPVSADATSFIIGPDLSTKIFTETVSATLSDTSGSGKASVSGVGGGKAVNGNASATVNGTVTRPATSCGAFENAVVSSLVANGSASNGAHQFQPTLTATNFLTDTNGVLQNAALNGQFFVDKDFGTFSGILNDTNPDKVPGHESIIDFSDGKMDFADFIKSLTLPK